MKILTLPVGELATNCYVVTDENGTAAIIDPGDDAAAIRRVLEDEHVHVGGILLTHGHFDHIGAVNALVADHRFPVFCHTLEQPALRDSHLNLSAYFGSPIPPITEIRCVEDGGEVTVGELTFRVLHTPGHTVGSVCYQLDTMLFAGDTLFCESIGRTDFPGGDMRAMRSSLARLAALDGNTRVFPGHGEPTTVLHEQQYNPYLAR